MCPKFGPKTSTNRLINCYHKMKCLQFVLKLHAQSTHRAILKFAKNELKQQTGLPFVDLKLIYSKRFDFRLWIPSGKIPFSANYLKQTSKIHKSFFVILLEMCLQCYTRSIFSTAEGTRSWGILALFLMNRHILIISRSNTTQIFVLTTP